MKSLSYISASSVLLLTGCFNQGPTGTLSVTMTDAPFPIDIVAEANVTINKIEVRRHADNAEGDTGEEDAGSEFVVLSEEVQSFNLLDLQNGVKTSLVDLEVETGEYNLIRLYVSDASVVLTDGQEFDLKIPSGAQTGIKIFVKPGIVVEEGLSSELLLDFDVAQSFVPQGGGNDLSNINDFTFKPTLRAINASISGGIEGVAVDEEGAVLSNVEISISQDDLISHAYTNNNGYYAVIGLSEGAYDVTATKELYQDLTLSDITVAVGNNSTADFTLVAE